jgi:hypothetical protein
MLMKLIIVANGRKGILMRIKLYEFFYLHDEADWLDVKFHEAGDEVDKFIVIECPFDLMHRPKPLCYGDNPQRFSAFKNKVIHVLSQDRFEGSVEINGTGNLQRLRIAECRKGFTDCEPDDILIFTEPDIVLKQSSYVAARESNLANNETALVCDWYMYNMDYLFTKEKYINCTAFLRRNTIDSEWATVNRFKPLGDVIENAGWHFCKIGDASAVAKHLSGYPHRDCDYPTIMGEEAALALIQQRIDNGYCWEGGYPGEKVVELVPYKPENYPKYVNEHPEMFAKYFKGGMNVTL